MSIFRESLVRALISVFIVGFLVGGMLGCSALRPAPAPTTPFLIHGSDLRPWTEHVPWDGVWAADPKTVLVKSETPRQIFVAPIATQYLNQTLNEEGEWVTVHETDPNDLKAITDLLHKSFSDAISVHPETNLILQPAPGSETITLAIALVELVPTKILVNSVADVGGVLLPGSKLLEQTAAVGAQAAGGAFAAGSIAIEIRLTDGNGQLLAEIKDRQTDPSSVIPNYRDFEKFGWSRKEIKDWAEQFVKVFSTTAEEKVPPASSWSFLPW